MRAPCFVFSERTGVALMPGRWEPQGTDGGTAVGLGGQGSSASEKLVVQRAVGAGAPVASVEKFTLKTFPSARTLISASSRVTHGLRVVSSTLRTLTSL